MAPPQHSAGGGSDGDIAGGRDELLGPRPPRIRAPDDPDNLGDGFEVFTEQFQTILKESPIALWVILWIKVLEAYSYFSISYIFKPYLTDIFGFTDMEAGIIYGIKGLLISLFGFILGPVVDRLGLRYSLLMGSFFLVFSRLVFAVTKSRAVLLFTLYVPMSIGISLGIPVLAIAVRRYTSSRTVHIAYGLFFTMMNIGSMMAGLLVDLFRVTTERGAGSWILFPIAEQVTAYRYVILTSCIASVTMLGLVVFFIFDIDVKEDGSIRKFYPLKTSLTEVVRRMFRSRVFWLYTLFISCLMGVRMIFRHLDATFPQYMERELGAEVLYGVVLSLNPVFVTLSTAFFVMTCINFSDLSMILWGTLITALSPLALTLMGASMSSAVVFVLILSIGEGMWSPRLIQFTLEDVAPEGREGTFMALTNAPIFLVKFFTGLMSGWLLESLCPPVGPRYSRLMWFIIGIVGLLTPISVFILRSWFSKKSMDVGKQGIGRGGDVIKMCRPKEGETNDSQEEQQHA